MASALEEKFDTWLSAKLLNLNQDADLTVFVSYISGILEADSPEDEKNESLFGILAELVPAGAIEEECQEIIKTWQEFVSENNENLLKKDAQDIEDKIHSIIEQQNVLASVVKTVKKEDRAGKAAILAQYAEISDGDEEFDDLPGDGKTAGPSAAAAAAAASSNSSEDLLVRNMNALLVKERERNERDRAKNEAEQKRQKDKDDRERQKQKGQERKESEKKRTQKGDRKR